MFQFYRDNIGVRLGCNVTDARCVSRRDRSSQRWGHSSTGKSVTGIQWILNYSYFLSVSVDKQASGEIVHLVRPAGTEKCSTTRSFPLRLRSSKRRQTVSCDHFYVCNLQRKFPLINSKSVRCQGWWPLVTVNPDCRYTTGLTRELSQEMGGIGNFSETVSCALD